MNKEVLDRIHHFENSDDVLVKAKLSELNVLKGWDSIPSGFAAASILCYRENDIWLFKYNPAWEDGWQYDMTVFKEYKLFPDVEKAAWDVINEEGAIERLPIEINNN